jgi:hypothetical protein
VSLDYSARPDLAFRCLGLKFALAIVAAVLVLRVFFRAKELRAVDDCPLGRLCSRLLGIRAPNAIEIRRSKWRKIA